jgi:hypothetical protein
MSEQQQFSTSDTEFETQDEIEEKKRIKAIFADMESKQLDFLDEAGKSMIERIATFLTVLFAVTAFGGNFSPTYLKTNPWEKYLIIVILFCYILAMGMAILAIQPRSHPRYRYQVQKMAEELQRMITRKKRLVQWAGILFALGTVALAGLIVAIILPL